MHMQVKMIEENKIDFQLKRTQRIYFNWGK